RRCGQHFSKPRRGYPVHWKRCSTVALLRGTAARFEWTPMLLWAADLVFRRKRLRRSTTTRKAHSSRKGKGGARIRRRDHGHGRDVDDELFARLQRLYASTGRSVFHPKGLEAVTDEPCSRRKAVSNG